MTRLITPWVMMNQLQGLKVAVQSHPAQKQQADLRLEKSKYPVILIVTVLLRSHFLSFNLVMIQLRWYMYCQYAPNGQLLPLK